MKKKILMILTVAITALSFSKNVYASTDAFYTTAKGIELTRDEYTFLTTFFWDGYPDIMTEEQYKEFLDMDLMNRDITIKRSGDLVNDNMIGPVDNNRATQVNYHGRTLQIGAGCDSTTCYNSIVAIWNESPNVRSYDVIGAYMSGPSLISHSMTYVSSTTGTNTFNNLNTATHGIGNSVKLPDNGENIVINIIFTSTKNGLIFGSYEHAMSYTTLSNSQNYTFSLGGQGNVFDFNGNSGDVYDDTLGVDITV